MSAPRTFDDGRSREFTDESARHVVARALAEHDGWGEIRPGHWTQAARVLTALRASRWPIHRAKPAPTAQREEA